MDELALLTDLHRDAARQGPGSDAATRQALALSGLTGRKGLRIADIGCGTGASTLVLAADLDATITAVDFLPDFLSELTLRAQAAGLSGRITCQVAAMEQLDFQDASLDAIWSEGAIYNIGFRTGLRAWRRFLRPGGVLAVSDLTWLTAERPAELDAYWTAVYPEVATAGTKIAQLEAEGYTPLGYLPLSGACWLENYYRPMQARFDAFLARNPGPDAQAIVAADRQEIALYERFSDFVSYGFYIARKTGD
ncbi:class I SAM-dependent methyltransferase [Ruegeria marina]|uniref:Methyltransferase domain-containing protein n=1 Tax=Ruegeria marina TaxID=639004 RepID=A0A1G6N1A7_9RHOB|nr:class I SAM-dependent methyltransferase [Ruegeria marina]SDC61603.1 Methyltransferase domain-containing protein [Ruegeria marina]